MEGGQNNFERGLAGKLGVRINRNATAIIGDGQPIARFQNNLNAGGMPCNSLIHAVVEHFSSQMVQRALVGSADIHARSTPDRF